MSAIANFALRGAQFLFGIIILGLSVDLIRGHKVGDAPSTLEYGAFLGGVGILGAIIGILSAWVEVLQTLIGTGIDAVIALLNIAGGILVAIKMRGANCNARYRNDYEKLNKINIINGGCVDGNCWWETIDAGKLKTRCKQNQADMAFMFIIAVTFLASAALVFMRGKRS